MNPELSKTIGSLNQVIHEGGVIVSFLNSEAWGIIKRTLEAQAHVYKEEAFEAARSDSKSIKNFLGRQEAIEEVLNTIENSFRQAAQGASKEKEGIMEEAKSQVEVDKDVEDHVGTRSYDGGNPGLM